MSIGTRPMALANFWPAPLSQVAAISGQEALADGTGAGGDVELVTGRDDTLQLLNGTVAEEALADGTGAGRDVELVTGRDDTLQLLNGTVAEEALADGTGAGRDVELASGGRWVRDRCDVVGFAGS